MADRLSSRAQAKLAVLHDFEQKVQRIHGLVEQFAADRTGDPMLALAIKRALGLLKIQLTGSSYDALAELAAGMEIAAGRGSGLTTKARILREGVGSLKLQIEMEQRLVVSEERANAERGNRRG